MQTRYADISPYVTKDGSTIRELMHPGVHGNAKQSLAEATVPPGCRTIVHSHARSEELYHVTSGHGIMTLAEDSFAIAPGDTICIRPGTPHALENTGEADLVVLCCCSPPYAHEDTYLREE